MTSDERDLTRRRLLGLGLLTAGAVMLESAPGAAEALARSTGGPTATSAVLGLPRGRRIGPVNVPGGFDLAGLRWRGDAHPTIELRARRATGRWTEWLPVAHAHDHGPDGAPAAGATDPIWTGRADEVQLRSDRLLDGLTLHTVRTAGVRRRPKARAAQAGAPGIITREDWGAAAVKTRGSTEYGSVQCAFVHHTVNANEYGPADSPAIVLAIMKYHVNSNHWNDIGYNFLVDKYGQIFEGRAGGIDQPVIGAQAQGFNSVSTGVSNIGTFESVAQTDAALNALAQLIAWKLAIHGVPVDGTVDVVSAGGSSSRFPSGRTVTLQHISGHRDVDKTSCPGTALYLQIPEIRRRAIAKDYPVAVAPVATPQITVAAAASQVAAYSDVAVTGALSDFDGSPLSDVQVLIQKLGATRWSTAARARTDANGHFGAPVVVRQSTRIRAYYDGAATVNGDPLTSSEINVSALPSMTVQLSAKQIPVGGTVTVKATLKPSRPSVELTVTKKGSDGRYRTVRRARLTVKGTTGTVAVRLTQPGLYGFSVAAAADARAAAVTTPLVHVRVARGAGAGRPTTVKSGGAAQPGASEMSNGGVAASVQ